MSFNFDSLHGLTGTLSKQEENKLKRKVSYMQLDVELSKRVSHAQGLIYDKFDGLNEGSRAKMDMTKTFAKGVIESGATRVEVESVEGFKVGQELTVYDNLLSEHKILSAISSEQSNDWSTFSAGVANGLAVKNDGTLWAWGYNHLGQLGNGTTTEEHSPIQIGTDTNWKVAVGYSSQSFAIKTDGTLWSWGYNANGQLGHGDTTNLLIPKKVGTDTNWKSVSSGQFHTLAIKEDGTLWAWGYNNYGQVGDGTNNFSYIPKKIGTDTNWKQVSARANHSIALKTDGSLWGWGHNVSGELGDGTNTNTNIPKKIGTATDWKEISAGNGFTLAIKNDGKVWGWGINNYGQLADNRTSNNFLSPIQIGTATDWKGISAGNGFTLAIKNDGTLWGWGYNVNGQLGDGTTTSPVTAPKQIGTDTDWKTVSPGNSFTLALKNDGTLWAWGNNTYGRLGDGTTDAKLVPSPTGFLFLLEFDTPIEGTFKPKAGIARTNAEIKDGELVFGKWRGQGFVIKEVN